MSETETPRRGNGETDVDDDGDPFGKDFLAAIDRMADGFREIAGGLSDLADALETKHGE